MTQNPGLSVRQHEREEVRLPVQFVIADEHREQVRFSSLSSAPNRYTIHAVATDVSRGGLGVRSRFYLPRMCEGIVRIFDLDETEATPVRLLETGPVIEARAKVRRVILAGHEPTYVIGFAFIGADDGLAGQMEALCERRLAGKRGGDDA